MEISFVILTHDSAATIERCLDSLLEAMRQLSCVFEVFVIDNGSTDESTRLLARYAKAHPENIRVTVLPSNLGTTVSRNMGLRQSTGRHVVIMDSDTYVNADAITVLRDHLEADSLCGLVVPAITYADGRHQISTDRFPTLAHKAKRFFFLKRIERGIRPGQHRGGPVDYAISAFWMMPATVIQEVGLFDERIFYSPEDVDFCIRVWRAGLTVEKNVEATVIHDAQEISRPKTPFQINRFTLSHIKGMLYLFRKHRYFLKPPSRLDAR